MTILYQRDGLKFLLLGIRVLFIYLSINLVIWVLEVSSETNYQLSIWVLSYSLANVFTLESL